MAKYNQGKFKLKHPEKYIGDSNNVCFRSGWECTFMIKLDNDPNVLKWASEEIVIPYISPIDRRIHRYFPDFYVETNDNKLLIEIKPHAQTQMPQSATAKSRRRLLKETYTFAVNKAKWEAAKNLCDLKGWEFVVLTENHLFNK